MAEAQSPTEEETVQLEANGFSCVICEELVSGTDFVSKQPPCTICDMNGDDPYCTVLVHISDCPAEDPKECKDEDHHFGRHKHVKELG